MDECRCSTCGLLAVRHKKNRQFLEAEKEKRETWDIKTEHREEIQFHEDIPTCFAGAISFKEKLGASIRKDDILKVLREDRECPKYTPWIQGFTPREHKEMVNDAELRRLQEEGKKSDRVWNLANLFLGTILGFGLTQLGKLFDKPTTITVPATTTEKSGTK